MKPSTSLISFITTQVLCILAKAHIDADRAALEAECGGLGVMEWNLDELPQGTNITNLRKCREHPTTIAEQRLYLHKRSCRSKDEDTQYGCADGWCWKTNCDTKKESGHWCWLAYEGGHGDWTSCGHSEDCRWSYDNDNVKCGQGGCSSCRCSC